MKKYYDTVLQRVPTADGVRYALTETSSLGEIAPEVYAQRHAEEGKTLMRYCVGVTTGSHDDKKPALHCAVPALIAVDYSAIWRDARMMEKTSWEPSSEAGPITKLMMLLLVSTREALQKFMVSLL